MEENNYIVYMHKNKINGKIYIGITKQLFKKRCGNNGEQYKKQSFYKAIIKYGWDNFEHIILYEKLTQKEAEQKEIELINYYKSNNKKYGYNIDKGGIKKKKTEGNVTINVIIPIELKQKIKEKSNKIGLSLATYIRYKLTEIVNEDDK